MESVRETEPGSTFPAPQGAPDPGSDANPAKPSGLPPLSAGRRPSIGEDDGGGGGAEAKLFAKGLAATSLLQIAIRNGIYQNQAANALGGAAKHLNMPPVKTPGSGGSGGAASVNSLLGRRRQRHRRNRSLGAPPTSSGSPGAADAATAAAPSPLSTLSLDRRTFLRQRQTKQLQPADRSWVRADPRRGCVHVHDWLTPSYPRPVLCSVDTTAGEVAARLEGGKAGAVLRITGRTPTSADVNGGCDVMSGQVDDAGSLGDAAGFGTPGVLDDHTASNSSSEVYLSDIGTDPDPGLGGWCSGSDLESSTCEDAELHDSLSDGPGPATDSSVPSPTCDSAPEDPDPFESSSDEVDPAPVDPHVLIEPPLKCPSSSQTRPLTSLAPTQPDPEPPGGSGGSGWPRPGAARPGPALFVQLHGGAVRRLEDDERPLRILNEYLSNLGYEDPRRVQGEGMNPEVGCLIRFYFGKPRSAGGAERAQLSGVFNVRKGKLALPASRWSRRQVTLSGTCLIVSSARHAHTGKMHILPLIGGKVEEVRRHAHCLAFSSAAPQSRAYFVSYESYGERLRWQRTASKVASQRISSADLSCCSLEEVPTQLFYSHDLTHLNLKSNFLSPQRGVAALSRFCHLRSLSLSSNGLTAFPPALCHMASLTELNLSGNRLSALPADVGGMSSLQTLLLDGNALSDLPVELGSLGGLTYLGLSFNRFTCVPPVLERLGGLERLCLAGNQLGGLELAALQWLPVRHVDLRLNRLRAVTGGPPEQLIHVTQLDLRDGGLQELDVRPLRRLELLRCDRNALRRLQVAAEALRGLHAAHNELEQLEVDPAPELLSVLDVSWNRLGGVPEWVCDCPRLEVLDVSHNGVTELPVRLMSGGGLRKLLAGWNQLGRLAERLERPLLEVLDLQHNRLTELPPDLFIKAQSLRYLNVSANRLESLPAASQSEDGSSSLEELYATNNRLTERCVPPLTGHTRLRVLHLAFNQLQSFTCSKLARLEQLEELDLSGNRLRAVPPALLCCRRLHSLAAHSNAIDSAPEVLQLPDIKCVDLSCNELTGVTLPETPPPKLQEFDLTGNQRLNLDHRSLELLNNIRCLRVDPSPSAPCVNERHGTPAVWRHGYTEASGVRNKLCVAALALDGFCGIREALYGVFDGDRNVEVPYLLQCTMGDVLAEELQRGEGDHMTNTFLTTHRKLGTAGQRMGGAAALCHIRHAPLAPGGCFTLTAANVGRCGAVLCRDGRAVPLSHTHTVQEEAEYQRVRRHNAIITEDNKVSGVTDATRMMGYAFLCPSVTPKPHVATVTLTPQDEFFILGSRGLWEMLSPGEAVEAVRNVPDALAAAKKLVTLAQGGGCGDSLSAVVVQLSITEDCCGFCEPPPPPPSPGLSGTHPYEGGGAVLPPPPSSGTASELSEFSTSEMSSEVGSTASSDEPPLPVEPPPPPPHPLQQGRAGARRPAPGGGALLRQLSGALSEDEEPIAGVFSNGSRVEVEADVHCLRRHDDDPSPGLDRDAPPTTSGTLGRRGRANGSVACRGRNQDLIEEAGDAPVRKQGGGYFNAPPQPDPDDQLIIPPELEEEVRQIIQQQQELHAFQKPPCFFTPL
ncbi:PH domain leucine-rich repeat-containing protein phosphatase 1-like [Antennarius striatus]|uniref:PH domain leucine-rich repeat-containing protein phosphatase 1-like n=1 Tax=Antennarius striatus TaxID=241820 RepID=UPI0035AE902E